MTPAEIINELNEEFVYTKDKDQYHFLDIWRIMRAGKAEGDCEDYALTALWRLAERNPLRMLGWLITRKARLHFYKHKVKGTGHLGLEFNDRFVDNISGFWNRGYTLETYGYERKYTVPVTLTALKLLFAVPFLLFRK